MNNITIKGNQSLIERIKRHYSSQKVEMDQFDFVAKTVTCTISIFEDEILFEGSDALTHAALWSKKHKKILESHTSNPVLNEHIGTACEGYNDLFGPLVTVSCYVNENDISFINSLNIKSVSELTNAQIVEYTKQLINKIKHTVTIVDNSHYNKMSKQITNNAIRSRMTNESIVKMVKETKNTHATYLTDDYVQKKTYLNYLKNIPTAYKNIELISDANSYAGYIAAQILAKYSYLSYFVKMQKALGIKLPRGNQQDALQLAMKISNKHGEKILEKTVKINATNRNLLLNCQ